MADFFPEKYPKGCPCKKAYMYNVWNTVHPDQVKQVLDYANNLRFSIEADKVKEDTILITEQWREELEAMPFISKQKGRMSHLLKQKSKVQAVPKARVKYPAFDFQKRPRDPGAGLAMSQLQPQVDSSATSAKDGASKKIIPIIISKDVDMQTGQTKK